MTNLTRLEAGARSALIDVTGYRVELDLAQGATTFESVEHGSLHLRRTGGVDVP